MNRVPFGPIVWPLAFSQTITWATLFYTFPAFFSQWESDLGWTKTQISGALTCALLLSALAAPFAGRFIDRGYFVNLHVGATAISVLLLLALSMVQELWQFYAVWSLIGVAMSCVLYEPCFAILTHTFGKSARAAIIRVSLVAGLAGTISFPAAHILTEQLDWRRAIIVFAIALAGLGIPLAWYAMGIAQNYAGTNIAQKEENPRQIKKIVGTFTFWMLVISYVAFALDHSMILTHLLPLLDDRNITPSSAIIAASLLGPAQVAGRLAMMGVEKHISTVKIAAFALATLAMAGVSLYFANFWFGLVIGFVFLQGVGNGVSSIVRPLLTAELLGRKNFGLISGIMALPFIAGIAAGPLASAYLWQYGGYDLVLLFAVTITIIGIITLSAAAASAAKKRQ